MSKVNTESVLETYAHLRWLDGQDHSKRLHKSYWKRLVRKALNRAEHRLSLPHLQVRGTMDGENVYNLGHANTWGFSIVVRQWNWDSEQGEGNNSVFANASAVWYDEKGETGVLKSCPYRPTHKNEDYRGDFIEEVATEMLLLYIKENPTPPMGRLSTYYAQQHPDIISV